MLIILDRDGVINYDSPAYIKSPQEWIPIPGSLQAIARLNHAGFHVVLATNQSGLARGFYSKDTLNKIHQKMHDSLALFDGHLDGIYYCPHQPEDACACRKPNPGLLHQIANDFAIDLSQACLVGDSVRDIQAAQSVKCRPILVKTGNGSQTLQQHAHAMLGVEIFTDLVAVADSLIKNKS